MIDEQNLKMSITGVKAQLWVRVFHLNLCILKVCGGREGSFSYKSVITKNQDKWNFETDP